MIKITKSVEQEFQTIEEAEAELAQIALDPNAIYAEIRHDNEITQVYMRGIANG